MEKNYEMKDIDEVIKTIERNISLLGFIRTAAADGSSYIEGEELSKAVYEIIISLKCAVYELREATGKKAKT